MFNNRLMIAEIYDIMAARKLKEFESRGGGYSLKSQRLFAEALDLGKRAELYRDIDRLGAPIGHRTR